ncbi:MAG: PKD domain-containing protein, partial [Casimicrobiaceae bacterium]
MYSILADRIVTLLRAGALLVMAAAAPAWAQAPMKCDVNGDRIIDLADIQLIIAARGHVAAGPNDPRDANNNKVIDDIDARMCTLRCSRTACSTQNSPPIANAGPDQSVPVGATVHLSGALSTDIDGPNPLSYAWTLVTAPSGSATTLINAGTVSPEFVLDLAGTYKVHVVVNDGIANSAPDEIVISTANSAPTANAGPDQTRRVGDSAVLTGAASSDPDGNALSYQWTLVAKPRGSAAAIVRTDQVNPTLALDQQGTYVAQLVVNDGYLNSAPDTVVVTTGNSPPVANAGPDQSVFVGDTVTLNGTGSTDVDGDPLTYSWTLTSKPAGSVAVLVNAAAVSPTFVVDKAGTYTAQLIVNDGTSNSAPDVMLVATGNTAPVANPKASCAASPNTDCSVTIGTPVGLDASASTDVDGNALTYAWSLTRPAGSSATLTTPTAVNAAFTTDAPGPFIAQLIVNDGTVNSVPKTLTITSTNVKPTAVATLAPASIPTVPQIMQLDGSGSTDPEGQGLTYAWALIAKPSGSAAVLSSATAAKPTFTADLLGTYTAQLIVDDGFLPSNPVTASASTANQAPTANAGPDQTVVAGATVQLTSAGSSDPEGSPLGFFWSLLAKPAGSTADFNNANAATPTLVADKAGTYVAQLIVNDGVLASAPDTVQVTATSVNAPPVADAGPNQNLPVPGPVQLNGAASSDPEGQPLTFAWSLTVKPAGSTATLNNATIVNPTFTADLGGTYVAQLIVSDGVLSSAPSATTIIVADLPTVSIAATTPNASETGPVNGVFTFTRTGPTTFPLQVNFSPTGTANRGADYVDTGFSVTIPAGQSSATLTLTPQADAEIEGDETVIVTITASPTTY